MKWCHTILASCILGFAGVYTPAYAQVAGSYLFAVTPTSISGPNGSTIGWGYSITNESTTYWLFGFDVQSNNPFQYGTATADPFNYPLLAPGTSLTVAYDGIYGLADLTWDADAPIGFTNSGDFTLTSYFFDNDPSLGGNPVGGPVTQSSPYSATVSAPATVPEPSSKSFFGAMTLSSGGVLFGAWSRSRHSKG